MALRLHGHKLPPLPTKPRVLSRGHSEDEKTSYTEDYEDIPLLAKSGNERKTSDFVSSIKDACSASSNSGRQILDDKQKIISTKVSNKPPSLSMTDKMSTQSDGPTDVSFFPTSPCPVIEKSDDVSECSSHRQDRVTLPVFETAADPVLRQSEFETFDLCITNPTHKDFQKVGSMFRSVSSFENGNNFFVGQGARSPAQGREQLRYGRHHKRPAIPRSRSESLATDEDEYSKYWRGEVTVVEIEGAELPQPKPEQTLDDKMAASALTRAIIMGNNWLSLECLKQGENPSMLCTNTGRSYFHVVASTATMDKEVRWVPMIYQLSNAGVDVDTKDSEGQSAVRIAIKRRLVQVLAALLKCGADLDAADEYHAEQVTGVVKSDMMDAIRRLTPSYWSAIDNFTHSKINRLIKAWSRVNVSRKGQTLIEYAKQHAEDAGVVKQLLHNEASIELAHAVMAGDPERVKVSLQNSAADLATTDTSVKYNSAPMSLEYAAEKYEHHNVLKVLKEAARLKPKSFVKADPYADVGRASKCEESPGVRPGNLHDRSAIGSASNFKNVVYYGSNNVEEPHTGLVTSALCVIL